MDKQPGTSLPIRLDDLIEELSQSGITETLNYLISMEPNEFKVFSNSEKFTAHQKSVMGKVRKTALSRIRAHEQRDKIWLTMDLSQLRSLHGNTTHERMNILLRRVGVPEDVEYFERMEEDEFKEYIKREDLTQEQKHVVLLIRKRLYPKEVHEQLQENKLTFKKLVSLRTPKTPDVDSSSEKSGRSSRKRSSASPSGLSNRHLKRGKFYESRWKELLEYHGLASVQPDDLEAMDIMTFRKYLSDEGFTKEQCDVLTYVRKRRKMRTNTNAYRAKIEVKKTFPTSFEDLLKNVGIDENLDDLREMIDGEFCDYLKEKEFDEGQKKLLVSVWELIQKEKSIQEQIQNVTNMETEDAPSNSTYATSFSSGSFVEEVKVEALDDSSISDQQEDTPENDHDPELNPRKSRSPNPQVKVNILPNGDKIFTKHSIVYPGHSYIYSISDKVPETSQNFDFIEIYECSGCIEVANNYKSEEARKFALGYLKIVKVSDGKIVEGDYDGLGHICVPLELMRKKYGLA